MFLAVRSLLQWSYRRTSRGYYCSRETNVKCFFEKFPLADFAKPKRFYKTLTMSKKMGRKLLIPVKTANEG
jgi:hypothetical protein